MPQADPLRDGSPAIELKFFEFRPEGRARIGPLDNLTLGGCVPTKSQRKSIEVPFMSDDKLVSRKEFRAILGRVISCTRGHLDQPGITPFTAEEVYRWFQQITLEDVRAVFGGWEQRNGDAA
jgi:hypothetical protein